MMRLRRWFAYRFLTRVSERPYNPTAGRLLSMTEWEATGGWDRLRPGVFVERWDWWDNSGWSGVTDATVEVATARLNEWQDDMARRSA